MHTRGKSHHGHRGWGIALLLLLFVLTSCDGTSSLEEHWPAYTPNPAWKGMVEAAVEQYTTLGITYKPNLQNYTTNGDWLNYGVTQSWSESESVHFDADGVPLVNYGGKYYYQPVTVSIYALSMYGRYVDGREQNTDAFFKAVHRLVLLQDDSGAFRYPFAWQYYLDSQPYPPGWVSGMAQGLALSVMARAYELTGDQTYLKVGDQAMRFLLVPVSAGGVTDEMTDLNLTLFRRHIFEEYVAHPSSFTLNGFMFTLLGVYDWSQVPGQMEAVATSEFDDEVDTLRHILPYYDAGGFTAYDMSHITYGRTPHLVAGYHAIHIYLLHALASITGDKEFTSYEKQWASYVPQ